MLLGEMQRYPRKIPEGFWIAESATDGPRCGTVLSHFRPIDKSCALDFRHLGRIKLNHFVGPMDFQRVSAFQYD
jgi:hypothetical protein